MRGFMTISRDTILSGAFRTKGKVRFEGRLEGGGTVDGILLIAHSAKWKGNVVGDIVIIQGSVRGDIVAREQLIVLNGARIVGNLYSPVIKVDPGAQVTGGMMMRQAPPAELLENPAQYQALLPHVSGQKGLSQAAGA